MGHTKAKKIELKNIRIPELNRRSELATVSHTSFSFLFSSMVTAFDTDQIEWVVMFDPGEVGEGTSPQFIGLGLEVKQGVVGVPGKVP